MSTPSGVLQAAATAALGWPARSNSAAFGGVLADQGAFGV
jgi:hypothetical protein